MTKISIVEVIQLMLAPGIMISACGLLLLGMNNKYSLIVNRIRLLNEERRRFLQRFGDREIALDENVRLASISKQLHALTYRVKLVRNAVFCYTMAVALFVLTSLCIGIQYYLSTGEITFLITGIFLLGMLSVLLGIVFAGIETMKGYEIIQLEVKIDE